MNNLKEVFTLEVDDYHVTPLDKYAKCNSSLAKSKYLTIPFVEGSDYISKDIVTAKIEDAKEKEAENEFVPSDEKENENEIGLKQISIFDFDEED